MKKLFLFLLFVLAAVSCKEVEAPQAYGPVPTEAQMEWQEMEMYAFIHFSINTFTDIEWGYGDRDPKLFSPTELDCRQWAKVCKDAGFKGIIITAKHHDGFCLWPSRYTEYSIKQSPWRGGKGDLVKELSEACKEYGLKLGIYLSPWDRNHRDYGTPEYITYFRNQLRELLTNYGPVGAIWFDGWWDQDGNPGFNWELPEQYAMIHKLQPGCLIGNNHHQTPFAGEDIQIFERNLPGENTAGLSGQSVSHLPLETCETMNGMWGYKITDQNYKSTKTLIHYLVKAAGKNANLLMNIGPQPDGELPEVAVQRLKEMGEWMNQYGETIYGTRGGAVAPHDWGVTTQKGNKLYVHILNLQDKALFLPLADKKVKKAVLFKNGTPVRFTKNKEGVLLEFTEIPKDIDYVVELTID